MKRVLVRYKLAAHRVAEHEAQLTSVFAELAEKKPAGLSYEVLKLADGLSFHHIATLSTPDNPLLALTSFKAFTADIAARCEEPPSNTVVTTFGSYG